MFIIKHKGIFFAISGLAVLASLISFLVFGFNLGTDFKGGTIIQVSYPDGRPAIEEVRRAILKLGYDTANVQPTGEKDALIRLRTVNEEEHSQIKEALTLGGQKKVEEASFSSIGPAIGRELARRGLIAISLTIALIILFIAFAFRGVSKPVSSWKYGLIAIVALLHDISIPIGVFSWLGATRGVEVDALFLTALLTVFALSVNDTIVIFDRIRENLRAKKDAAKINFEEVIGQSLDETVIRSFNSSVTIILTLASLFIFGSESTRYFSLALLVGMIVGTYSSIFLAAPLLVAVENWQRRRAK